MRGGQLGKRVDHTNCITGPELVPREREVGSKRTVSERKASGMRSDGRASKKMRRRRRNFYTIENF